MPESRTLEERLRSVEQALSAMDGEATGRVEIDEQPNAELEATLADLETRVSDLEAGLQAIRGYVGNIHHVNEAVERRANAAIAAVERLETTPSPPPRLAMAQRPDPSNEDQADSPEENADRETATDAAPEGDASRLQRLRSLV